jgi:hypothetical protein
MYLGNDMTENIFNIDFIKNSLLIKEYDMEFYEVFINNCSVFRK